MKLCRSILGIGAIGLVGFVGCGSSNNPSSPSAPTPTPTPGAKTTMVSVGGGGSFSFSPQQATINAGDTVMWQWSDTSVPHTVTSGTPGAADGKFCSLPPGSTVNAQTCNSTSYATTAPSSFSETNTFKAAGTYPYFCMIHGAMMTGTIVVQGGVAPGPTPTPTPTPTPGY